MMASHIFNEPGQVQMPGGEISDIFDVLEGGEDEGTVKFLLGFNSEEGDHFAMGQQPSNHGITTTTSLPSLSETLQRQDIHSGLPSLKSSKRGRIDPNSYVSQSLITKEGKTRKRDPVDPSRCVFNCESCTKSFTTKFNLKRHINLHCDKSKEAGVPIQGPPSASTPSRKSRERKEADSTSNPEPVQKIKKKYNTSSKYGAKQRRSGKSSRLSESSEHLVDTTNPLDNGFYSVQAVSSSNLGLPEINYHQPQRSAESSFQQYNPSSQMNQVQEQVSPLTPTTSASLHQSRIIDSHPQSSYQEQMSHSLGQSSGESHERTSVPQQYYQQRIVQIVQPQGGHQGFSKYSQQAAILGQLRKASGTIPVQYHGEGGTKRVLQAFPVSIVQSGSKSVVTRAIQVPQQPLHVVHSPLPPSSYGIAPHSQSASISHGNSLSVGQKYQHQRVFLRPTSSLTSPMTVTSSMDHIKSSTVSSPDHLDHQLSSPPDDLFDSEDSNVAEAGTSSQDSSNHSGLSCPDQTLSISDRHSIENNFTSQHVESNGSNHIISTSSGFYQETMYSGEPWKVESDFHHTVDQAIHHRRDFLHEVPKGWVRKQVMTGGMARVFYYNASGKRFSNATEVNDYLMKRGLSVKPGLFNFIPSHNSMDSHH